MMATCGQRDAAHAFYPRPERLLTLPEVLARIQVCRAHWYKLVQHGAAPKPRKLGRSARWVESELDAYITTLAARP
jgi:prophage regulatory protein